jgi:anthranilate synthase component 1
MIDVKPALEQAKAYCDKYTLIPVAAEIFSDIRTPMEVLRILKNAGDNPFILESVENGETWGRYTFLGYNPCAVYNKANLGKRNLREIIGSYKSPRIAEFPPFTGGFAGYFAFDYITSGEFCLMLYKRVIAFDHLKQKIFLIVNIDSDNLEENYTKAVAELQEMQQLITDGQSGTIPHGTPAADFSQTFSEQEFIKVVEKVQDYIAKGEAAQVVPSIKFTADFDGDLLQTYRKLRTINPSSYMFYMQLPDNIQITGASPETLVSLKNGIVSTYPLAGTCKRTKDESENRRSIQRLLSDEKELIEHEMLVELSKADLAKICESGSVVVEDYRTIKTCSHVYHIESKVRGKIRPQCDALDALMVSVPAGTLCGSPRPRAMEIISEIEGSRRDIYGGAVGYIDFTGEMDLCIGIRMAILRDGKVSVQAGAGIVAQSVPVNEYNECCNKAKAMLTAIRG